MARLVYPACLRLFADIGDSRASAVVPGFAFPVCLFFHAVVVPNPILWHGFPL